MNDYNRKQKELKKDKEGDIEFRPNEKEGIIKGAKQEDQLNKLNKGEKARKDDSGSRPVDRAGHSQEKNPNEF